jgi:hypothetical protein
MTNNPTHLAAGCIVLSLVVLVFFLNRLGVMVWIWWVNRVKRPAQDSSARKYWNVHG